MIVVNIASHCGLAKSQYSKMMQLREKYHDKGLRIIALPSSQFLGQMPESNFYKNVFKNVKRWFMCLFSLTLISKLEGNGDETMQHLKEHNVEFDLVMAKVSCIEVWNSFIRTHCH